MGEERQGGESGQGGSLVDEGICCPFLRISFLSLKMLYFL